MPAVTYPAPRRVPWVVHVLSAILGGLLLFLAIASGWTVGYQLVFAGRIFPGVSVGGVDLSGLSPQDAALKLSQTLAYPINGRLVFRDKGAVWSASPAQLGMIFDPSASAQSAYRWGRSGNLLAAWAAQLQAQGRGYAVAPVIVFDERVANQYLQNLGQKIDQPVTEASLHLEGTNVVAQPGQTGRLLNVNATLIYLAAQLQTFSDGEVPLVVQESTPSLSDVSSQASAARAMLSEPLQLTLPDAGQGDAGPWVYDVPTVAAMLGVERVQNGDQVGLQVLLDPARLRKVLTDIANQVDRQPANAYFHFDTGTRQLVLLTPSVVGRAVDVDASLQAINDALARGVHSVPIVVRETQPAAPDNATAQQLGITQAIAQQTSFFWGSNSARIQNITTAAARFDGVLVAPGETFSMGQALGDVSLNNGFTEALIIYGGHTIKGVGGGVCQVSTTLFRTVFFAGFPVVERVPHAYRVSYYEETSSGARNPSLAGLDATVYFPLVDFKFKNDSPYWILMQTQVDLGARALIWTFYSTSDGRSVNWNTSGPQNIVPAPKASFEVNRDLPAGALQQTDYAANGADIDVQRTVMKNGAVYFQDEFQTHYQPWQAVCQYAVGLQNPDQVAKRKSLCQAPTG